METQNYENSAEDFFLMVFMLIVGAMALFGACQLIGYFPLSKVWIYELIMASIGAGNMLLALNELDQSGEFMKMINECVPFRF